MEVALYGTRGSLAAPGPETARYGGNTACVSVTADDGTVIVLDAGTGIRRLGRRLPSSLKRVDLLLSHLHMDHIQGLGFFAPLNSAGMSVHIWGPPSATFDLRAQLMRYLSPPLFPVRLRDLECDLVLHDIADGTFEIGSVTVTAALVCHPGPTLGYRLEADGAALAYLPDHELALGGLELGGSARWMSGYDLAKDVDLLIHDAQFSSEEYPGHEGWGHSTAFEAVRFAARVGARRLLLFHHSPDHDDDTVDAIAAEAAAAAPLGLVVTAAAEGQTISLDGSTPAGS